MPTKPAGLTRDQFALALHRLNPLYAYRWTSATEYEWRGLEQPDGTYDTNAARPTDQQLTDAWAAYTTEQAAATTAKSDARQAIVSVAQGAVGKTLAALTANEVKALLAVLLYKEGALNADTTVKPLNQWMAP